MRGESAALATALLWTITAITFEYAGKRIGAKALNFLRLVVGSLFLGIYGLVVHGSFAPFDASIETWLWLGASGLVGLVIGDLLLFQAFIDFGARLSMLVYALSPAFAAILGWLILGETLGTLALVGMALTLAGIALAILGRPGAKPGAAATQAGAEAATPAPRSAATQAVASAASRRLRGILVALLATFCQAGGLILSKIGAPSLDAFSGTQVRVLVGVLGFGIVLVATGSWKGVFGSLRDRKATASLVAGSFFGPFLGVSLSLAAVQGTQAGIAASIMSLVPIMIILPSVAIFKEKIGFLEVLGALIAVAGTALLFL
ncbi:MAG: DMT family transporter [Rectinemataceae bacterium]